MIRQATVLGLMLVAGLNVTPILAAKPEGDCAAKRQVIQEKIEAARQNGHSRDLQGLQRALGKVEAHCDDAALRQERLADVKDARQEVEEREMDLRDAMGKGDQEKIGKRQAKLAEARAELEQAEAEARSPQ